MKKNLLLLAVISFFAVTANAQIPKGSIFIGGSFNFSSENTKPTRTTDAETLYRSWSVRPQLGKAIDNNKIVGIFLNTSGNLNRQSSPPSNISQTNSWVLGGGVFLRNYFSIASRFYLFGESSLGMAATKSEGLNDNGTVRFLYNKSKGFESNLSLTPGISFAATKKVHLEASLNNLFLLTFNSGRSEEFSAPGNLYRETKTKYLRASANANGFSNLFLGVRFILP